MAIMAKKLQPAKTAAIEETKKVLGEFSNFVFVDYRGLTVEQITKLRAGLREKNSQLKVFKNNFARLAFDELKNDEVAQYLSGPTAIALIKDEANESAKVLFDFAKDTPALVIKGAWVDGELYDAAKIEALAKLPGKKQLIAMLMSAINGPARKLAGTLQAYVEKLEKEGPAAAAPAAEAAPAPAAE
ncbi:MULTISPECIES: 50S ribosomal protein L10 [Treponema]|jgi:large subunit ribosomal protein L10|uniref:Large ribosomal subunit protein uL10 n=1 Tax=Treponema rectale TaxID=744512 RepID=A0A840SF74_9SPIR|nr:MULTISPECIES: 50S ribosomal protein L10 [Treponema]MBB5218576.1 large subunit ribosomal protein L10 [Treponema rectale]MBE6355169.1 50S ribosomal protein L10 [Treponema sp.]